MIKVFSHACIIDDDAIAVFGLKRAMAAVDFTPKLSTFEHGLDALEHFGKLLEEGAELPCLIFMDLNMPVIDGWNFMDEFKELLPNQKNRPEVYIMTSSMDARDVEKAKSYGLEGHYLIKPVSPDVLREIVG